MRITRDTLITIARETVEKRAHSDPDLLAAYLTGSLLTENPFLGNATDIDIVFVHNRDPKVRREILPLTPEVHLDLRHNPRSEYEKPKELRVHPWLGPELYDPLPLHGTQHFFEFVQAGVRDKYLEPANVLARARTVAVSARQSWNDLQFGQISTPELMLVYLATVQLAANAVALLTSYPLSERRFLLQFPTRAEAAGQPELTAGLLDLLGAGNLDAASLTSFLPDWEKAFIEASGKPLVEKRISGPRLGYYKLSFESLLASETPQAIVWPLILTWTISACVLPQNRKNQWDSACKRLGLDGECMNGKLRLLDRFLDHIEELLEKVATNQGL